MIERGQFSSRMRMMERERFAISRQLTPPQTQRTAAIGEIIASERPSAPKRMLILVMSALLGVMAGVMLAFVAAFVARAKTAEGNSTS